jgi:transcription factor CRZ1
MDGLHRSPSPHSVSARHTPTPSVSAPDFGQQPPVTASQHQAFDPNLSYATSQSLFAGQSFATANPISAADFNSFQDLDFGSSGALSDTNYNLPLFTSGAQTDQSFIDAAVLDPALDPSLLGGLSPGSQSLSPPAGLSDSMAATLNTPTMHHQHHMSPRGSPAITQSPFQPPHLSHSRNSSLDPSSAYGAGEWGAGPGFQGHRRTLSDAHSEVSSAQHSPYAPALDSFDHPLDHSPHLNAQDPLAYQDMMGLGQGLGQVSLSEAAPSYISPAHSPAISPRLPPSQLASHPYGQVDSFNLVAPQLSPGMMNQNLFSNQGYGSAGQEAFPSLNKPRLQSEMSGQSDPMSPPEINIIIAPPSRQNTFEPQADPNSDSALRPPDRCKLKQLCRDQKLTRTAFRMRSSSDPSAGRGTPARDTLSPRAAGVGSRSPSPSGKSRRSSTSNVPNRDYILDLADPDRPASNHSADNSPGGSTKRGQKHPATFQCSLCPKRFTRAYNLRSHLRTHTDERPFVCSHCGKAFARQHDRKRHEGLHSGEKKFVCRGSLKDGNPWGCGRRFARADALGRHFRSEAGRLCIKPLMDEEALERMQNMAPATTGAEAHAGMPVMMGGMPQQQQMYMYNVAPGADQMDPMQQMQMPMRLPAALLQQYPGLGNIWDQLPANGGPEELEGDMEHSGRNSFSSAGEFEEDDWSGTNQGGAYGWASDVGP